MPKVCALQLPTNDSAAFVEGRHTSSVTKNYLTSQEQNRRRDNQLTSNIRFCMLSQIYVVLSTYSRQTKIGLMHRGEDCCSNFSIDFTDHSLAPSRPTSPFALTSNSASCFSRRRRAPRMKKKSTRMNRPDVEFESSSSSLSSSVETFGGCFPWYSSDTAFLCTQQT